MRRLELIIIFALALLIPACNMLPEPPVTAENRPTVIAQSTSVPDLGQTSTLTPDATSQSVPVETNEPPEVSPTPVPTATPAPTLTPTPTALPADLSVGSSGVFLYPYPSIFAGDKVTFQIYPAVPEVVSPENVSIDVLVDGQEIANGMLGGRSHLSGEPVGLFEWVWDTTDLVGMHQIEIVLDREDTVHVGDENLDNNQTTFDVRVEHPSNLTESETNAIWKTAESVCCHINVVSVTASDRDLPELLAAIDLAVQQAESRLGVEPQEKLNLYLVDRVIGQGGYAGSSMVVSYLDRDYANNDLHQVLVHEAVHLLDRQIAPRRIAFFAEGLAVWASEGHYKREDINQASAALLEIGEYIPLEQLINRFYPVQHEIGYLEAAGLVGYLVDTYGWFRFQNFYGDVTADDADSLAGAVDYNTRLHFGVSLSELESAWVRYLRELPLEDASISDLATTIRYYDTMRRYQVLYDPTAYFLIAWLPAPDSVREAGNPADLTRHPETPINVTLEVMLIGAGDALQVGDYGRANVLLSSVERVLDSGGHFVDPFAISYWNIVQAAREMGYEVYQVTLEGDQALVLGGEEGSNAVTELHLVQNGLDWMLTE